MKENLDLAWEFLAGIGKGAHPEEIAALFSPDVDFEIGGEVGALPWIGKRTGRVAVRDFICDSRRLIERVHFNVQDVPANDGELSSSVSWRHGLLRRKG